MLQTEFAKVCIGMCVAMGWYYKMYVCVVVFSMCLLEPPLSSQNWVNQILKVIFKHKCGL